MFIDDVRKNELVNECERLLLSGNKIKFSFDKNWSNNFTKLAGVYAVFCNDDILYIGESASIKERMKEIKRTINHSFRKKLGKHLYKDAALNKGKFADEIEKLLNEYYITNIYVSFVEITFGRIEIEEELIKRNANLLNSIGVRSSKY
jgi:predicted GIY-YIG superfamily endonuclease